MAQDGGALFDSGLLGSSFHWWIGQIADDSVWKENIVAAPHATASENIGWGRRYKVRILGLHDQGETEIPSKDLPWANVMMPVTSGGSLNNSGQTPALRQGNMVFGFFMDGTAMTVPVIMGVLSNNAQNEPALTVGDNRVTNKQQGSLAVSGYADGQVPKDPKTGEKPTPPDGDLKSEHPNSTPAAQQVPANVKLNKFGLRPDQPLSAIPGGLEAAQAAREKARAQGKSVEEVENAAMAAVANIVGNQEAQVTAPTAPFKTGAQRESPDVQNITAGDVKEQDLAEEKTVMPIPDDPVGSALKAIQTIIDNITQKMDKYLNALQSYVDTVSSTMGGGDTALEDMICKGAMQAAKYMKVLFDKIMEFVLKQLNAVMTKVVASMPSSFRNQMGDLKEKLNEMILGMYNQMIAGLGDQMCATLLDTLQPTKRKEEAEAFAAQQGSGGGGGQSGIDPDTGEAIGIGDPRNNGKFRTAPKVPMCFAESVASTLISKNKKQIEDANNNVVRSLNKYLEGVQSEMDSVASTLSAGREVMENGLGDLFGDFGANADIISGNMDGAIESIPDIAGGLGAALDFANVVANVFAGELEPKKAINDYYQLATGGSGAAASELPSVESVGNSVAKGSTDRNDLMTTPTPPPDYASPRKDEPDVELDLGSTDENTYTPMTQEERDAALEIA
jgi:hypothetical protein